MVITEPPGEDLTKVGETPVYNFTTGAVRRKRIARLAGEKEVEPGVRLRVFHPAR
jgi:hypothetical protein